MRELAHGNGGRVELVGLVDDSTPSPGSQSLILGKTSQLGQIVDTMRPDLVALVPGCNRPETFSQLLDAASAGFRVLELSQFYEHAFGRLPVRALTRAWFMSVLHLYQRPYSRLVKRFLRPRGCEPSARGGAPLWPILVVLARSTRGPIFVRQTRVGEHGRVFTMYKFPDHVRGSGASRTGGLGLARGTRASREPATSCGDSASMSCHRFGTSSRETCQSWGPGQSDPSSSTNSMRPCPLDPSQPGQTRHNGLGPDQPGLHR